MLQHSVVVARSYDSATQQFQGSSSIEGQSTPTGAWGNSQSLEGGAESPPQQSTVEPLPVCAWSADHVNKVRLIGIVGGAPEVRQVGDQLVAQVSLGVRPKSGNNLELTWLVVDCWNAEAQQVAQYVQKGMQIAVGGHLKQSKWTDKTTGQRREALRVVAEYVMAVDRTHGVLEGTAAGAAPKAARQRQPRERGPSTRGIDVAQKTLDLFNQGHSIPDISRMEGKSVRTVTGHLIDILTPDNHAHLPQLASDLELGPPGSPWMTADEINEAIETVLATSVGPDGAPATLDKIYLRHVREAMGDHPTAGAKQASQEQLAIEKEGLTYHQIRLVIALKQQGISWNDVIVQNPAVPSIQSPMGQQQANSHEEDDEVPF
ncbi:probable single-stranded DNA-binding protein at N-terminal half [Coccomyxa sp. Obi]|nr:probable single-stranded DNA-binding protein at N-terminal half [Coccomyxa sp. Obi]